MSTRASLFGGTGRHIVKSETLTGAGLEKGDTLSVTGLSAELD